MKLKALPKPEPDIEFTVEMIEAGVRSLLAHDIEGDNEETVVRSIFADMYRLYRAASS